MAVSCLTSPITTRGEFIGYNQTVKRQLLFFFLAAWILSTGCSVNKSNEIPVLLPDFVTATLPAPIAPLSTSTVVPPSPMPTNPPIEGTTTTQVNVRSEPSTIEDALGMIAPFSNVQILGREPYGAWYQIIYSSSPNGKGWITAAYTQVNSAAEIPVLQVGSDSGSSVIGLVIQPINVRSGPGTSHASLGTLSTNDVITVTGKDVSGEWMQIKFKNEAGWVASEFLKVDGTDLLPEITDEAQAVGTDENQIVESPSPVNSAGVQDNDSIQMPLASIVFSKAGVRAIQFKGNISSSNGDREDWLQLNSTAAPLLVEVECTGSNLYLELLNDEELMRDMSVICENGFGFTLAFGQGAYLHIQHEQRDGPQISNYALKVKMIQP